MNSNTVINYCVELARECDAGLYPEHIEMAMQIARSVEDETRVGPKIRRWLFKQWGMTEADWKSMRCVKLQKSGKKAYLKKMAEEFDAMVLSGIIDPGTRDDMVSAMKRGRKLEL